jgi:hypothetical protein
MGCVNCSYIYVTFLVFVCSVPVGVAILIALQVSCLANYVVLCVCPLELQQNHLCLSDIYSVTSTILINVQLDYNI